MIIYNCLKVREAEGLVSRMVEEGERRAKEADSLKQELFKSRVEEKDAKEKLIHLAHFINNKPLMNHSSLYINGSMLNSSSMHPPSYSHGRSVSKNFSTIPIIYLKIYNFC